MGFEPIVSRDHSPRITNCAISPLFIRIVMNERERESRREWIYKLKFVTRLSVRLASLLAHLF